jgi:hypothetical protein
MINHDIQTVERPQTADVNEVRALVAALTERLNDIFLRGEVLHDLLIKRGLISKADFDLKLTDLKELWSARRYFLVHRPPARGR